MAEPTEESQRSDRWEGRPVQAAAIRVVAVAIPVGAGVAASVAFSHAVRYPDTTPLVLLWWIAALALSTLAVAVVERQCRRILPLAALLKLSMVFPDKAPSRFGVALRAGTVKNLEDRVRDMRGRGVDDEPSRAAAKILELVGALSVHDRGTRGHAERVRAYSDMLGAEIGLNQHDRDRLRWAALLHDVGKVAVPSEVLNKAGKPDEEEWKILHRHPEEGAKLAAPLRHWLGEWADTIEQHHERWDGLGYPHRLKGEEISRGARIVGVVDAFDVMTAARSYKKPMEVKAARLELTNCAGTQFDPAMVRAFLNISLGRMRWMVGPLAWIAELPFLGRIPWGEAGGQVAGMAARVAAGATIFAGAVGPAATASGAPAAQPSPPPAAAPVQKVAEPVKPAVAGDPTPVVVDTTTTVPPTTVPRVVPVPQTAPPTTATPAPTTTSTTAKPLPPNVPPVAVDDTASTTAHAPVKIDVTANDSDPDGDGLAFPVTYTYDSSSGKGANLTLGADGHTFNYVPNNHYTGTDSFQYTVCDTRGGCDTATVTVNVA